MRDHGGRTGDLGVDMGVTSSMQYTVGTALERARQAAHDVEVLVDGHWVGGTVLVTDGTGVVLEREDREHSVVRLDRISAVRVSASAPMRPQIAPARVGVDRNLDGSIVMPAPRQASA
jgi:hypothetical protein